MKKTIKTVSFILLGLLVLAGCDFLPNDEKDNDSSLYVLTEMSSNRGNTGYKKGDVVSYSIDLNAQRVSVNEFMEDGVESELKEYNNYELENLEESEEQLSFSFDDRKEMLLKKSISVYESEVTGMQYHFQEGQRN